MTSKPVEKQLLLCVRNVLTATGTTQAEVARRIGCSKNHLSKLLTGQSTLSITWAARILESVGYGLIITAQKGEG